MYVIGIIPARYRSIRLSGKPLIEIKGKSMVQRVYMQALQSKSLSEVWVATDDERIEAHVKGFGGKVVMTSLAHRSGTERCNEVLAKMGGSPWEVVVNIQGDEPFIQPGQIDTLVSCFENSQTQIATLIKKIEDTETLFDVNVVKVICNTVSEAIYFSRMAIPYQRDVGKEQWLANQTYYKHIGMYAYRPEILNALSQLPPSALEKAEALEQLRWIENGYRIKTQITKTKSFSIDTLEDLQKATRMAT